MNLVVRTIISACAFAVIVACGGVGANLPPASGALSTASISEMESPGSRNIPYYAFFSAGGNRVEALDQSTNTLAYSLAVGPAGSSIDDFEIDRLHRRLFVLSSTMDGNATLSLVDIKRRAQVDTMVLPRASTWYRPYKLAVGQGGQYAYYLQGTGGLFDPGIISRINVGTHAIVSTCKTGHNPVGIVADASRPLVYASWYYSQNGAIGVLNANVCRFEKIIPVSVPYYDQQEAVGGYNSGLALSRSGSRLYMASTSGYGLNQAGGYYNRVYVIDTASKNLIAQPATYGGGGNTAVAVSPNGAEVVAQDCSFAFTNLINTNSYADASLLPGGAIALGFNRDGSRLYEADSTKLNVVDMASRTIVKTVPSLGITYGDFAE